MLKLTQRNSEMKVFFGFLNSAIYFSSLYCTVLCIELGSMKLKQRLVTKTKSVERHDSETQYLYSINHIPFYIDEEKLISFHFSIQNVKKV